jgi:hypothetical protein
MPETQYPKWPILAVKDHKNPKFCQINKMLKNPIFLNNFKKRIPIMFPSSSCQVRIRFSKGSSSSQVVPTRRSQ